MELIPIKETIEENGVFVNKSDCRESIYLSVEFYKKTGYNPPWIGYYAKKDDQLVGSAAFKGQPQNGKVEIAYGTFEKFRQQGIGTEMCRLLVELSKRSAPDILITARTLPEKNYSTKILEKNDFELSGSVIDPEDGEVWEWNTEIKLIKKNNHKL